MLTLAPAFRFFPLFKKSTLASDDPRSVVEALVLLLFGSLFF